MKQLFAIGLLGLILIGCTAPKGQKCHMEGHEHNEREVCINAK